MLSNFPCVIIQIHGMVDAPSKVAILICQDRMGPMSKKSQRLWTSAEPDGPLPKTGSAAHTRCPPSHICTHEIGKYSLLTSLKSVERAGKAYQADSNGLESQERRCPKACAPQASHQLTVQACNYQAKSTSKPWVESPSSAGDVMTAHHQVKHRGRGGQRRH